MRPAFCGMGAVKFKRARPDFATDGPAPRLARRDVDVRRATRSCRVPRVDRDDGAGDVLPRVAEQVVDGGGDVVHLGQALRALRRATGSRCSSSMPCVISVSTNPGATALTVTPGRPTSRASERVKPTIDALVAPYTDKPL